MNLPWKEDPTLRQFLLGFILILLVLVLFYIIAVMQPGVTVLDLFSRASGTRTSIALTSQALYGPFPTATGPTQTPTRTPSITPSPTVTPTGTASPTPIRYFLETRTPRTRVPGADLTSTAATPVPTNTSVLATRTPIRPT